MNEWKGGNQIQQFNTMVGNLSSAADGEKNIVHQRSATPSRSQRDPPWCGHIEGVTIPVGIQAWVSYAYLFQYIFQWL